MERMYLGMMRFVHVPLGLSGRWLSTLVLCTSIHMYECISVWAYLTLCAHIYLRIESMMLCRFSVCVGCHCLPSLKKV